MAQLFTSVAIGTAATLLATILFLLRSKFHGRRSVIALARRWVTTTPTSSGLVLAFLCATAIFCFAIIADNEFSRGTSAFDSVDLRPEQNSSDGEDESDAGEALRALRAYADRIDGTSVAAAADSPEPSPAALPDVDTMIAKLIARLEKQPNDVNGWKMLGWSYLNMERPEEAAKAYETALKLEPGNAELKKGLEAAKSVQAATLGSPSHLAGPSADDIKFAESPSNAQRSSMIRDTVERLAARLETSPNDENGWLRLMSSHTTLGEKDAAEAALTKALSVFANNAAARMRLMAAARELGLESN